DGDRGDVPDAASAQALAPASQVTVSTFRRQVDVLVPHRAWDPGRRTVRLAAGVGLWNTAANRYLVPGAAADATHPGGAAGLASPTAFFNVAFRYAEPWQHPYPPDSVFSNPAWWRGHAQGTAPARGD